MQRTTQRTMQGEVFVPAILEPLRDCGMCLESKRAVVCVNQEARRIFTEHLREHALDVDWGDCTLSNARFVVESGVQIAVQGERLLPVMSRTFFKKNIRLKKNAIEMRPAAAFFLGHILAKQECIVRLTTGEQKCLTALRTKPRISLADNLQLSDRLVLAPSLHQNALQRIRLGEDNLILAELCLDDDSICTIAPEFSASLKSLDLSRNEFGCVGIRALPPMHNLDTLCLSGTHIPDLPADMFALMPMLQNLLLSNVQIDDDGMERIAPHFHKLEHLKVLDLSCNPFSTGIHALLRPDRLPLHKLTLLNLIDCNRVSLASYKNLAHAVRNNSFPVLQDLCVNKLTYLLRAALRWLEADRNWRLAVG